MFKNYYNMGVAVALKDDKRRSEFLELAKTLNYLNFKPMTIRDENGHWMPKMYEYWCEMPIGDMDNYDFNRDCLTLFNNGFTLVMTGID